MCGLAWRWLISRSVKKPSRIGSERAHGRAPLGGVEAGGDEGEQLGGGRQIPVGVGRVDVAEVGRQQRHAARATSTPSRYQPSRVRTAKLWRRSCGRGRHLAERGCESGAADEVEPGEVGVAVEQPGAGGRDEERRRRAGVGRARRGDGRRRRAPSTVLGCSGTSRDLPNLVSRIRSTPSSRSTSSRSRRSASPMRIPVTASSPIRVSKVAARSGERSWRAAAISAAMSASEYR